ncbi:MAG: hypothetical protein K2H85_04335, partial [Allobaculum sp.]|nr:hypothetical protein [Allobaculum sp.]
IINTDLEILGKMNSSENKEIKVVGGKYYMALVTEEDFDHREQYLAIYDYNDKLMVRTEDCDPESSLFYYLGNGIFCFENSKGKAFLLTTSGILKEYPRTFHTYVGTQNFRFKEGATQALLTCDNPEGDTICILDKDGTFQSVSLKDCYGIPGINSKGLVLYYSGTYDNLTAISQDITKQNEVYKLNDDLSKRLVYLMGMGALYQFNENGIGALSFRGADEKNYIGIFDSKLNQIGDMIQGTVTKCYFEDGLIVVYLSDGTVAAYNEKGEKEFEFPKGTIYVAPASDGVFAVSLNSKAVTGGILFEQYLLNSGSTISPSEVCYITTDGKRLFDEITQS